MCKRILVVDDDASIRDLIDFALTDAGYEVLAAPHGAAALQLLARMAPDVILLDMRMPVMDGWQFAQAYRQIPGSHAPIVVLTAAVDAASRAAEIKADGYLAKPFQLAALYQCLQQYTAGT
jgi:two-component system, chemotaxis family, chemotaxis protein CheY